MPPNRLLEDRQVARKHQVKPFSSPIVSPSRRWLNRRPVKANQTLSSLSIPRTRLKNSSLILRCLLSMLKHQSLWKSRRLNNHPSLSLPQNRSLSNPLRSSPRPHKACPSRKGVQPPTHRLYPHPYPAKGLQSPPGTIFQPSRAFERMLFASPGFPRPYPANGSTDRHQIPRQLPPVVNELRIATTRAQVERTVIQMRVETIRPCLGIWLGEWRMGSSLFGRQRRVRLDGDL